MKQHTVLSAILAIQLGLTLVGCSTMQSIDVNARSRTFDADYATTLKAAIDYLNAEGWQVAMVDKELGIINTEFKSVSGFSALLSGGERYKMNFSVQKQTPTQTMVIANMLYEKKSGGNSTRDGEWVQATMTEKEAIQKYNEILGGIQSRIRK